jgi:hypothetical protein
MHASFIRHSAITAPMPAIEMPELDVVHGPVDELHEDPAVPRADKAQRESDTVDDPVTTTRPRAMLGHVPINDDDAESFA